MLPLFWIVSYWGWPSRIEMQFFPCGVLHWRSLNRAIQVGMFQIDDNGPTLSGLSIWSSCHPEAAMRLWVNRIFDLCNLKSVLQFTANLKANLVAWVSSIYLWSRFRFKHWPEAYPQLRTVISYVGLISADHCDRNLHVVRIRNAVPACSRTASGPLLHARFNFILILVHHWFKGTETGCSTQRAMPSATISSSAILSLGVMEHWNDSGWLQVVISIHCLFPDKGRWLPYECACIFVLRTLFLTILYVLNTENRKQRCDIDKQCRIDEVPPWADTLSIPEGWQH